MQNSYRPFLLSLLVIFCNGLISQTLDKNFLESLPEEQRLKLIQEINDEKAQENKKILRPPSTAINKQSSIPSSKFGIDFFKSFQSTFMPINEPIFDPAYVLGFGDELTIQFTGQKNDKVTLIVNRDGSINLPEIGKLIIAGLSLERADQLIQEEVKSAFIGVDSFTTLSSVRDMQILVVGEAAFPGVYTVPGNAGLLNVLNAAGGFSPNANIRNIELKRDGKIVGAVDLYQALIFGDFSKNNIPIKSGDTIFINFSKFEVVLQGGVRRPGSYELLEGETFEDLLTFANGYNNTAIKNQIQLSRIEQAKISYKIYDNDQLSSLILKNDDVITVSTLKTNRVEILGEVSRPGTYLLPEKSSIIDLINIAGGYKDTAYPFAGIFLTESAKLKELESLEKLRKDLIAFSISNTNSIKGDSLPFDIEPFLSEIENLDPAGRVSIDFEISKLRQLNDRFFLSDLDKIIIPAFQNIVHVYGEVENSGSFLFSTEKDAYHYIKLAGSVNDRSSGKIILYHPNGESEVLESNSLFKINKTKHFIYPGTLIYIPRDFELGALETTNLYLPVVSNLAITLASIATLSNANN